MEEFKTAFIQSPRTDFVELARTPSGKLYRKQILKFGNFTHPNGGAKPLAIDAALGNQLVANFKNGVVDIVQIPVADDNNKHVEDPFRNIGEVVDLAVEDDGVYATMDVRKNADDVGKTLLGVSAMMSMDYQDVRTGERVGPTLLHTAITNRPYITNLKPFEDVIAASADAIGDEAPVILTRDDLNEEKDMTKEELIAELREKHGIDVVALTAAQDPSEMIAAMTAVLQGAGAPVPTGEEEAVTIADVAEAVIELSQEKVELSAKVDTLTGQLEAQSKAAIEAEIDGYVTEGRILPKSKDAMVEIALSNREQFDALLPETSIVDLSTVGKDTTEETVVDEKFDEDVDRLVKLANDTRTGGK